MVNPGKTFDLIGCQIAKFHCLEGLQLFDSLSCSFIFETVTIHQKLFNVKVKDIEIKSDHRNFTI